MKQPAMYRCGPLGDRSWTRAGKNYFLVILASPDPTFTKKNYQNYQLYVIFMYNKGIHTAKTGLRLLFGNFVGNLAETTWNFFILSPP